MYASVMPVCIYVCVCTNIPIYICANPEGSLASHRETRLLERFLKYRQRAWCARKSCISGVWDHDARRYGKSSEDGKKWECLCVCGVCGVWVGYTPHSWMLSLKRVKRWNREGSGRWGARWSGGGILLKKELSEQRKRQREWLTSRLTY